MLPEPKAIVGVVRRQAGRKTRDLADALGVPPAEFEPFLERLLDLQVQGELIKVPRGGWVTPQETDLRAGRIRLSRRGGAVVHLSKPELAGNVRVRPEGIGSAFDGDIVLVRVAGKHARDDRSSKHSAVRQRGHRKGRSRHGGDRPGDGARQSSGRGDRMREGRVVEVLRRSEKPVLGRFWALVPETRRAGPAKPAGRAGLVRPAARHLPTEIYVAPEDAAEAKDGERVLVRLLSGESYGVYPRGKVMARLRDDGSLDTDFQLISAEFGFPVEHPQGALAEAAAAPALTPDLVEHELQGASGRGKRVDLRGILTITIDPRDAQDFDDAVSLEDLPEGGVRLGVHIADVSHYIPPGSELDRSAEERGTSIYLPGRVVPMIPERLSNDLCSLRPDEDRLTKTVSIDFNAAGDPIGVRIFRSLIRNRRRFTYEEVLSILDEADRRGAGPRLPRASYPRDRRPQDGAAPEEPPLPDDAEGFLPLLVRMAELRDLLWGRRRARGALDLDLPRLRLEIGADGEVAALTRDERDPAHHLIEEFMLAANEAVARYLDEKGLPLVSRLHDAPDEERLDEFFGFLESLELGHFRRGSRSKDLQKVVEATAAEPLAPVIQLQLLQSLAHAEYAVGPGLHFALAAAEYCHFTSPIRRYPDLLVHQVLDEHWDGKPRSGQRLSHWFDTLPARAAASSQAERRAEEAEREMTKLRLIRYLEPRAGEEMPAMVVSVLPFGLVIRAQNTLIEGLIHVSNLQDDYYQYDEGTRCLQGARRGRTFRIGDRVRVVLAELNPDLREINFRLKGSGTPPRGAESWKRS